MFPMDIVSRKRSASDAPDFGKAGEQGGPGCGGVFMLVELRQGFIDYSSSHSKSPVIGLDLIAVGTVGHRKAMREALKPQLPPTRFRID
mgnify:CR=1 FL=1